MTRRVVVAGGGTGIGRATAQRFTHNGDEAPGQASSTTGMIIGRRRCFSLTQRPVVLLMTC